ncbi:GDSL-like protein [Ancylostoma caninum]|uniref:GDSL-like protein n=1 Tax=Ancylostoma caninum TaxID=29170 RepID=A0A368GPZ0_ANCCA|nr:GDSL-like protein [Ancylostoma caninum]
MWDYNTYLQYYSTDRPSFLLPYQFGKFRFLLAVLFTLLLLVFLVSTWRKGRHDFGAWDRSTHKRARTLGGELHCDPEVMKPSSTIPSDVNKVRPGDLKVIAAIGDSITVASLSKDFEDDMTRDIYPGNSYIIGGDGTLAEQISVGKVLREFNPNIVGLSHGTGYDNTVFNVAVGGRTSEDMPRQARDLIARMKQKGVSLTDDWKIVTIFIGTNDMQKLRCFSEKEPISREAYKANLEEAISLLRENLNRTIISIVSMWNSQLVFDAQSLIEKGERMQCGDHYMEKRDILCNEYRKVAYEIQNERRFDSKDFTVVVQGFMDNIRDAFRNKDGAYDKSFYAEDMFHLSKYGNGVIGKFLWNSMLEPVGNKSDNVNLGHDYIPLKCPTKERPYVQTLGNR